MIDFIIRGTLSLCIKRNIVIIGLMGFFAGLPLLMCGPILAFWLSQSNLDISIVSFAGLSSIPYALKFLWVPFIEYKSPPLLNYIFNRKKKISNHKLWLISTQLIIGISMILLSQINPLNNLKFLVFLVFVISVSAATQESIMLAYDLSRLNSLEYSMGEAMRTSGYRLGMLCSSVSSLYLSSSYGWGASYFCIGILLIFGSIFSMLLKDSFLSRQTIVLNYINSSDKKYKFKAWILRSIIDPISEIKNKEGWIAIFILTFIYKAGDNLVGNLHNVFYTSLGFSKIEIAEISKIFGTFATIIGCIFSGGMINRIGLGKSLIYGCLTHAIATYLYVIMYGIGYNKFALYGLIFLEHFTGGFRTTALFTLRMYICQNNIYSVTQMALLSSISTMGRSSFSIWSGWIVKYFGWKTLFTIATLLSVPGLVIVLYISLKKKYSFLQPRTSID
ncbi:MFS transporter [Lyticum sinuosum]|uniref:MFS transporter n=1 Tax=Lyticum sinuosum TaxID=1332059 RepID=A0AAE4VJY9_9RICK|nr:MFS transporter [Lyticum sinuosum]MDZ5761157.1 MFS transporter [Lyticum sinuosum]